MADESLFIDLKLNLDDKTLEKQLKDSMEKVAKAGDRLVNVTGKTEKQLFGIVRSSKQHLKLINDIAKSSRADMEAQRAKLKTMKEQARSLKDQEAIKRRMAATDQAIRRQDRIVGNTGWFGRATGADPYSSMGAGRQALNSGSSAFLRAGAAIGIPIMGLGFNKMAQSMALGTSMEQQQASIAALTGGTPSYGFGHLSKAVKRGALTRMGYSFMDLISAQRGIAAQTGMEATPGQAFRSLQYQRNMDLGIGAQAGFMGGLVRAGVDKQGAYKALEKAITVGMVTGLENARLPEYLMANQSLVTLISRSARGDHTGSINAMMQGIRAAVGGKGRLAQPGVLGEALAGVHQGISRPADEYTEGLIMRSIMFGGGGMGGLTNDPIKAHRMMKKGLGTPGVMERVLSRFSGETAGGDPRIMSLVVDRLSDMWGVGPDDLEDLFNAVGTPEYTDIRKKIESTYQARGKSLKGRDILKGTPGFLKTEARIQARSEELLGGIASNVLKVRDSLDKASAAIAKDLLAPGLDSILGTLGDIKTRMGNNETLLQAILNVLQGGGPGIAGKPSGSIKFHDVFNELKKQGVGDAAAYAMAAMTMYTKGQAEKEHARTTGIARKASNKSYVSPDFSWLGAIPPKDVANAIAYDTTTAAGGVPTAEQIKSWGVFVEAAEKALGRPIDVNIANWPVDSKPRPASQSKPSVPTLSNGGNQHQQVPRE